MHVSTRFICLSFMAASLWACTPFTKGGTADTLSHTKDQVLADTFFFGCAHLDANENSILDENDPKIPDVIFSITLAGGGGFSDRPAKDGCGMIIIPGGLQETHWPVTARIQPPEGASLELVGPAEILLEYPKTHADFLFSQR